MYIHTVESLNSVEVNSNFSVKVTKTNRTSSDSYTIDSKSNSQSKFIHECSSDVVQSASKNPFPYLCKYFNIEYTDETIEKLKKIRIITAKKQNYKFDNLKNIYSDFSKNNKNSDISWLFNEDVTRLTGELNFVTRLTEELNFIVCYTFLYESPQGNSNQFCEIELNSDNIQGLIDHVQQEIEKRNSKEKQRSLMTNELRTAIKERDNYTCCNCGNSMLKEPNLLLEVDHIVPISKGGKTEYYNLQTLCWKCNRSKSDKVY